MNRVRKKVFLPPFLALFTAAAASLCWPVGFKAKMGALNDWLLHTFGSAFLLTGAALLAVTMLAMASPFGRLRIGGPDAKPRMTRWQWFSVNLTTSVAIGILFWGCAEPVFHLWSPAPYDAVIPGSPEAADRALVTMFLHWTFIPYAMYAVPALLFAYTFYNLNKPHCLGSLFAPLVADRHLKAIGAFLNPLCLFALAAGMAASLGTGLLTLSGGLEQVAGLHKSPVTLGFVAIFIVGGFVQSSLRGLNSGIAKLASLSSWTLIALVFFVLMAGPTSYIVKGFLAAFPRFVVEMPQRALAGGHPFSPDRWAFDWTIFYWAVWMAWAPVTAVFLGQIGYGRTVRDFLLMNLVVPALFSAIWMAVFSGAALYFEIHGGAGFAAIIKSSGAEAGSYNLFRQLPFAGMVIPLFIFISYLSFVSGADANTTAMAAISQKGITQDAHEPSGTLKVAWGILIGLISWGMISLSDMDGIRMLSNLGGLPVLFLEIFCVLAVIKLCWESFLPAGKGGLTDDDQH
ncbi:MAG: hypothetical protein RIQ81_1574 [Pseudomonadota bacterium]|jgi:choline-glycine betaine transporter